METNDLVQFLTWDSEFFQRRIGRILPGVLSEESWAQIRSWQRANRIECLYFLADGNDRETLRLTKEYGFYLTDVRVEYKKIIVRDEFSPPATIRPYQPNDLDALRAIARISHVDSRFYFDGHFPLEQCNLLYDVWISKSCNGYADKTSVADVDGKAVGYLTTQFDETEGKIMLVGIDPEYQGRGLGKALVIDSICAIAEKGYKTVSVVTQGRNIRAQCLYQKSGFFLHSQKLWFHWWMEPSDSKD